MSSRKGNISVKTTDIFPIIKKWLYSEHDIFLRELVANATDAITKRSDIARNENQEIPVGRIDVNINKSKNIITIKDNGLGMTEEEVEKYIAQLAFSSAEDFVKKMKDAGQDTKGDVIGKFGLGFYSAFMVADEVVVETLSMDSGAKPVRWSCSGDTEYTFSDSDKSDIGTTVTLHVNEDGKEFLDKWKVQTTLRKYCDFLPFKIGVLDEEEAPQKPLKEDGTVDEKASATPVTATIINEIEPLWRRDPKELTDDDYRAFYRKQFPMDPEPLFWIHLKTDHPFILQGILYFPKININKMVNERNIRLYCKQVFVSDDVKNIMPDFLSLLKGTIDSSDIPLNVSRSSLQGDPNIQRISNYVVKKVADSLKSFYKRDRKKYEELWSDIGLFIKYGVTSDPKFDELMRDKVIFKNSDNKYVTFAEYNDSIPEAYKEKMKNKILYFEQGTSDPLLRKQLCEEGIHSVETDDHIDPHLIQHLEMHKGKNKGDEEIKFVSIDSEIENLLGTEQTDANDIKIKDLFIKYLIPESAQKKDSAGKDGAAAEVLGGAGQKEVTIAKIKNSKSAAYLKIDEQMKRFSKMAQSMGQNNSFPVKQTLVINPSNPLIQNALKIHELGNKELLVEKICHHVEDLAIISSSGLKNEDKDLFVQRSQELMQELTNLAL